MSKAAHAQAVRQFQNDFQAFTAWVNQQDLPDIDTTRLQEWARIRFQSQAAQIVHTFCYAAFDHALPKNVDSATADAMQAFRRWRLSQNSEPAAPKSPALERDPDASPRVQRTQALIRHLPHPEAAEQAWTQWQHLHRICDALTPEHPDRTPIVRQWITQHFSHTDIPIPALAALVELIDHPPMPPHVQEESSHVPS